jgi:hypothetical protein
VTLIGLVPSTVRILGCFSERVTRVTCKVAREVVGGPRGLIMIIVEVIQCKVDWVHYIIK